MLSPFIECYYAWKVLEPIDTELVVESPPNGYSSIVFNMGNPYEVQTSRYNRIQSPRNFVAGQSIYSYKLFLSGQVEMIGIVFKPAGLASFFGIQTYELTEERKDLVQVFELGFWDETIRQLNEEMEFEDKIRVLERFLIQFAERKNPEADYVDKAANIICENFGMIRLEDLIADACVSRRTFERHFFQKVGLSPKYYARVRRISHVCNLIAGKQKVNWTELFVDSNYYDQAHFIKDFIEFTGRTPEKYLKENQELANFIQKPKTQAL